MLLCDFHCKIGRLLRIFSVQIDTLFAELSCCIDSFRPAETQICFAPLLNCSDIVLHAFLH